jgi:mannose-1-phosphate guanylyltransferase
MKALLLAAGFGSRLRPLTDTTPKCLLPIAGRPLLDYWLELCHSEAIEPLINTSYLEEQVFAYLKASRYRDFAKTVHEDRLLGTAGTLLQNEAFFRGQTVMLVHADNLSRFEMKAFLTRHHSRPKHCEITMMTFTTPTPESCGILKCDSNGVVQEMFEKTKNPPGNLANAAVYILEPSIFGFLKQLRKETIDFSTEVLPHYMGRIYTFHNGNYHRDIGTPESYAQACADFNP